MNFRQTPRFAVVALLALALLALPAVAEHTANTEAFLDTLNQLPDMTQGPVQVGEAIQMSFTSPAVERSSRAPRLVWSEELFFDGASYIAPHFGRFDLPEGASLIVRAPDGTRSERYEALGKGRMGREAGGFWGIHIAGDRAIVELYSRVPLAEGAVQIDSFARGYDDAFPVEDGPAKAICGGNDADWAQCYQGSEPTIYDKSRAVARLLISGTYACTGWLVGDEGHLMTNNHCVANSSEANNTNYEFMAERSCSTNCASWGACPGTIVATSATFVQTDSALDYTLVKLPTNPTGTYGFMQMRGPGATLNERIYIPQHPAHWGKQIAVNSGHSSDGSGFCEVYSLNSPACSGGPGDIGYYCDTQGGSSGSPVLGYSDHLVVALHHCANCPNRGVPIDAIINDLGNNVPNNAVVGDTGGPGPGPTCAPKGDSCTSNSDCCSNKCKGPNGRKTCK